MSSLKSVTAAASARCITIWQERACSRCSTTMSMSDILCVTNRKLCRDDFLERVREIAACRPRGILLREKDLPEEEYRALAAKVLEICREFGTPYILHSFYGAAAAFGAPAVHLPLHVLRTMKDVRRNEPFRCSVRPVTA